MSWKRTFSWKWVILWNSTPLGSTTAHHPKWQTPTCFSPDAASVFPLGQPLRSQPALHLLGFQPNGPLAFSIPFMSFLLCYLAPSSPDPAYPPCFFPPLTSCPVQHPIISELFCSSKLRTNLSSLLRSKLMLWARVSLVSVPFLGVVFCLSWIVVFLTPHMLLLYFQQKCKLLRAEAFSTISVFLYSVWPSALLNR